MTRRGGDDAGQRFRAAAWQREGKRTGVASRIRSGYDPLYGVIAFTVASRTREIGIRIALGAERRDIGRLVLSSSARLVITGCVIGCAVAFGVARWIEAQLFGVSPVDPSTYLVVAAAVSIAALAATWQPAAQAARIDPAVTLRSE